MTDEYRLGWETREQVEINVATVRGFGSVQEMRSAFGTRATGIAEARDSAPALSDNDDDYRRRLHLAEIECAK